MTSPPIQPSGNSGEGFLSSQADELIDLVRKLGNSIDQQNERFNKNTTQIELSNKRIDALGQFNLRTRRLIKFLAISLAFDLILSACLAAVAIGEHESNAKANKAAASAQAVSDQNKANARQFCQTANDTRAGEIQLWTYVISLPPSKPLTAQQKAQEAAFLDYVKKLFAPHIC